METDNNSLWQLHVFSTALLAAAVPLWLFLQKYRRERQLKYPPGPRQHCVFGNALDLPNPKKGGGLREQKQLEWSKEYGLFYTIALPIIGRLVVVMDPELAQKVLVIKNYHKSSLLKIFAPIFGNRSMGILNGAEWSPHRRAFNPGFAPSFLKNMVSIMAEKLARFIACIEQDINNNQATHMLQRAQTFTSDVIASTAFGEDWGGDEPHQARILLSKLMTLLAGSLLNPLIHLTGTRFMPKIRYYERLLDQEMHNILEKRLDAIASSGSSTKDICSIAIDQIKKDKKTLSHDDKVSIIHQLKTFYAAGHDTTASLIAWTMWLLSQNTAVLEKIRQELQTHDVWVNTETPPNLDQLQKCVYLEAVLKETLRLYPPVLFVTRYNSDETDTYKGFTIGGCLLGVNVYGMHRHPALWKEPDKFHPERFLDGSEGDLTYKYLPFSRGPRDCIGKHFAMLESKLAVSALTLRYHVECVDPNEKIVVNVTGRPQNGAQVVFSRRNIK